MRLLESGSERGSGVQGREKEKEMKFVRVAIRRNGRSEIAYVNLRQVEIITYNDEGLPVLWIGDDSWECPIQSLKECIVEI